VESLLAGLRTDRGDDRAAAAETGDWADSAEPISAEGADDAVAASLQDRLRAIQRAEQRLVGGTYGRSVRSGAVIPDERLEADPAAELTVDEAEVDG
jgi:DnaK suppressor protein